MRSVVLVTALMLAGCASYPKSAAVSDFSDAATKATALLSDAGKIDILLAEKAGYEESVTFYIRGIESYRFPPESFALLDKKRIAARVAVLQAIGAYAKAIGDVNDPDQPGKVGEAITKIGTSVVNFASVAQPGLNIAEIKPVLGIISATATYFFAQRSAIAIRDTAAAAHPSIEQAAALLKTDFQLFNRRFARRLSGVREAQRAKMRVFMTDSRVTSLDKEKRFQEWYDADRDLNTRVTALANSSEILDGLVKAHDDLRNSEDTDRAIQQFKTLIEAIVLNAQELKKLGAS